LEILPVFTQAEISNQITQGEEMSRVVSAPQEVGKNNDRYRKAKETFVNLRNI